MKNVRWFPADSEVKEYPTVGAVVGFYISSQGALSALGYIGRACKPAFHHIFVSEARRSQYVERFLTNV